MNETLKTIKDRYSCRDFSDKPLTDQQITALAEAAIQAPSANNSQRWHISIVKNKKLIDELNDEALHAMSELEDKTLYNNMRSAGGIFYHATCVIFISIPGSEGALDCGIVTENIALAATSLGLGSCICGLARFSFSEKKDAHFKKMLKFPSGYDFGMAVLLGNPATTKLPHEPNTSKISIID